MASVRARQKLDREVTGEILGFVEFAISVLREERGMSDGDIADAAGICRQTLRRLDAGRVTSWVRGGTVLKLVFVAGLRVVINRQVAVKAVSGSKRSSRKKGVVNAS